MNVRELEKLRAPLYNAIPTRRIRTISAAAQFINRVGFCWLFAPSRNGTSKPNPLELPSLAEAVKGRRGIGIDYWDDDAEMIWGWKSDLPATRRAYYGKGLAGRPVFVSLQILPYLLAASGAEDIEQIYANGGISQSAKKVYTALEQEGAMPTMALRRAAGFAGKTGNTDYHRALDELQRALVVMPIGATNEVGAWPSQIFDLVRRWFPDQAGEAYTYDTYAARRALVERYLKTVIAAPAPAIARLFNIPRQEFDALLQELMAEKRVCVEDNWLRTPPLPARR